MLMYDVIVIGFGKAGKTLAAKLSSQGKKVALIEKSKSMYGGTCINIACIPTKTLIVAAEKGLDFEQAMSEKKCGHHSSQWQELRNHCWNWCRHYRRDCSFPFQQGHRNSSWR